MGAIEPDPERFSAFLAGPEDGPIVMINLLRFREQAEYPAGFAATPCTGPEAYGRYSEAVQPLLAGVGGRPIWVGLVRETLIAAGDESWHQAFLVEYPSRKAFLDMVSSPDYQAIAPHRTAALADSRLIASSGAVLPPPE
ncbi:MAG: DUF1330 domain-containing protein [Myxococcales bacterium]|nr:DUF1330 domain-containing protein [Myxococcales bacterium]